LAGLVIVFSLSIYLSSEPEMYYNALRRAMPAEHRDTLDACAASVAQILRWWVLAKLISMTMVGILIGIGLWIVGVPLAVTLGIIAAVMTFIPNVGPAHLGDSSGAAGAGHQPNQGTPHNPGLRHRLYAGGVRRHSTAGAQHRAPAARAHPYHAVAAGRRRRPRGRSARRAPGRRPSWERSPFWFPKRRKFSCRRRRFRSRNGSDALFVSRHHKVRHPQQRPLELRLLDRRQCLA
jgi:hypothetical protein